MELKQPVFGSGLSLWNCKRVNKLDEASRSVFCNAVDELGILSGASQCLRHPITTSSSLKSSPNGNRLYVLCSESGSQLRGYIRVDMRHLFNVCYQCGAMIERDVLCVLDFYVHFTVQRMGFGKELFQGMVVGEKINPSEIAYDRPSKMLRPFLERNLGLVGGIDMPNRFMWRQALYIYLGKGQRRDEAVYYENEVAVIIYDGFPKAQKHLLLLPKQLPGVKTPNDLRRGHLEILRGIHSLAARVAAHLEKDGGSVKVGYHALPSMEPLHLHIMSTDMNSEFLKNRKHWNSFTTEFFRKPCDFEAELESSGHVFSDKAIFQVLEKGPMTCPKCGWAFGSCMKEVKEHAIHCLCC